MKSFICFWFVVGFLIAALSIRQSQGQGVNILFINDEKNPIADKAVDIAVNSIRKGSSKYGVTVDQFTRVLGNASDAYDLLDRLCKEYQKMITAKKGPHLVLDMTMTGVSSETAKSFTAALALPTLSTSFGQENDLRQWRAMDEGRLKYLIQIMPPADVIPEVVRSIVLWQNISSACILFDETIVMDHKYKALLQNIPTRHVINAIDRTNTNAQLTRMAELNVVNFFIIGRTNSIKTVLEAGQAVGFFNRKFSWYAITTDRVPLGCGTCKNASVMYLKPEPDPRSKENLENLKQTTGLNDEPEISAAFYYDVTLRAILGMKKLLDSGAWPKDMKYVTCEDYKETDRIDRPNNLDLKTAIKEVIEPSSYGPLTITTNGNSLMEFNMRLEKVSIVDGVTRSSEDIGSWRAGINNAVTVKNIVSMKNHSATTVYQVVTVLQSPFVVIASQENNKKTYKGYCIDLIEEIRTITGTATFEYEIYEAPDGKFGNLGEQGQWDGMIKELIEKRADIALGSLAVMAERENVVDFTVPYYDLVGITILMKKPKAPTSLFKFLTVLETDVWLCILAAYFFTSFLMWIFDRWSPYSYQNNREKYKDDEEKREFNLKECLWFCMTSLTPQGGGEAPKNISGRLVAATWWLFGFIIIASYTANLAAFLTVSRLDTPVESLDDLSKQYKIQYAPLANSSAQTYFERMANIETRFYEIWKDMSLNDSLSDVERSKLAVWDYPVSDKYTKIWQAMKEAKFPATLDEAVDRVRKSKSSSEGYAFLGDATDVRYLELTNCDLQMVGEEFSRKPYAIAVQQGSPLKDQFNNAILQLLNKRKLEKLKERWWANNPEKVECEKQDDQADGISIQNIGGVFIVIFVGIGMACVTLAFEYWWYKYKKDPNIIDVRSAMKDQPTFEHASGQKLDNFQHLRSRPMYPDTSYRRNNPVGLANVNNPW